VFGSFIFGLLSGPGYFRDAATKGIGRFFEHAGLAGGAIHTIGDDGSTLRGSYHKHEMAGPCEIRLATGQVVRATIKHGIFHYPKQLDHTKIPSAVVDETQQQGMDDLAFDGMFAHPSSPIVFRIHLPRTHQDLER
jgi:hypothetical protein